MRCIVGARAAFCLLRMPRWDTLPTRSITGMGGGVLEEGVRVSSGLVRVVTYLLSPAEG
jgi:hypothetical protein